MTFDLHAEGEVFDARFQSFQSYGNFMTIFFRPLAFARLGILCPGFLVVIMTWTPLFYGSCSAYFSPGDLDSHPQAGESLWALPP